MVGSGYGGYAALIGLVRNDKSDRLACAVAGFAPTDLLRLESRHWSAQSADARRLTLRPLLGDPSTDTPMLQAQSPLAQADRIHAPLLLAYGTLDREVPLAHGTDLRDKLAALGRPPEWVAYDDAGNSLWHVDQQRDLMNRIDAFLARYLAPRD